MCIRESVKRLLRLALFLPPVFALVDFVLPPSFEFNWSAAAQNYPGSNAVGPGSAFNLQTESYLFGQTVGASNLTGCIGGSPTLTGSIWGMKVGAGTNSVTTCTITWPVTRSVAPNCVLQLDSAGPTLPVITVENTTTLTWTWTTATASTVWDVVCVGPR